MASRRSSRRSSVGVTSDDPYQQHMPGASRKDALSISTNAAGFTAARPDSLRRTSSSALATSRSSSPALLRKASTGSLRSEAHAASGTPHRNLRRSSSQMGMSSPGIGSRSPLAPQLEEELPPPPTASSIAAQHFAEELALHDADGTEASTIVILHDACYGHRYSRPKTSKATLGMIVERPERIHAGILGITSAYVRIGERHGGGRHPPHPQKPPNTKLPFKIRRTNRELLVTSSAVTGVHGTSWMGELKSMCDTAGQKLATTGKELVRPDATSRGSGQPPKAKFHEGDLYLCNESLDAFQGALGGVCDGVDAVFAGTASGKGPRNAFVCVRPPGHHCSADYPSGFCWLNNVHVGIEYAAQTHGLTHAAIIDFDLHHGDGSQSITWQHNDKVANMGAKVPASKKTAIGYFSLHDINSYPCEDGDIEKVQNASLCIEGAHNQTIWNVHLQPWKTEEDFWRLYQTRYKVLLDKAGSFLRAQTARLSATPNAPPPKAAIFLSAGFDASEWESQGMQRHKVNVPTEFYARLTADVVKLAQEADLAVNGRVVSVLEGGYSDRALTSGVLSHLSGLCHDSMAKTEQEQEQERSGLAWDMGKRMAALALGSIDVKVEEDAKDDAPHAATEYHYTTEWWHPDHLAELEGLSGSQTIPPPPKKAQAPKFAPTFASPTQSFSAKVVDPTKIKQNQRSLSSSYSRPVTPPIPEVDWATAAHEMYKLLVPKGRTTKSCKPEELMETKSRKPRQSDISMIMHDVPMDVSAQSGRELRVRKAKTPAFADATSDTESIASKRSVSRSDRRKTIADFPVVTDPTPRPSSAVSRPAGAVNRPPSSSAMNVKKTRGKPAEAAVKTQPPVPRVPSAFRDPKPTPPNVPIANDTPILSASEQKEAEDPLSAITSGLQRIRIKVPTEEERAAKEAKKKADAAAAAAAVATEKKPATSTARAAARKPAAPKPQKPGLKPGATAKTASAGSVVDATRAPTNVPAADEHTVATKIGGTLHQAATPLEQPSATHQVLPSTSSETFNPPVDLTRDGPANLIHQPPSGQVQENILGTNSSAPEANLVHPQQLHTEATQSSMPKSKDSPQKEQVAQPHDPHRLDDSAEKTQFVPYIPPGSGAGALSPPGVSPALMSQPVQGAGLPQQSLTWMPTNGDIAQPITQSSPVTEVPKQGGSSIGVSPPGPLHTPQAAMLPGAVPPAAVPLAPHPQQPMAGRPDSRGRQLPVFTSNSPIPFAAQNPAAPLHHVPEPHGGTIADIIPSNPVGDPNHNLAPHTDIWEVPETPLKR